MKHLTEKDNQFYPTPKGLSDKLFSMLNVHLLANLNKSMLMIEAA